MYHFLNRDRYHNGWDPNSDSIVDGQKRGHPLRNHQPPQVKNAHRRVTDAAYFADIAINVAVSAFHDDLVIVHKGLHHVPHGLGTLRTKRNSDMTLRDNSVSVIDVPEHAKIFCMSRVDDGVNVFRTGTTEAGLISMTRATKRAFLHFLIDDKMKKYSSEDAGRDVGCNVHRYDLMFNQSQGFCDQYSDAHGTVIVDNNGSPLRVPLLRKQTEMLRMLPGEVKREFTRVLAGLDNVTQRVYPDAFSDKRRRDLVHEYFVRDYLGHNVSLNWEYIGLIARKVSENDSLAMHLDVKNDWRKGYDYCSTYSFVLDSYRVTIIAACKVDFGHLMDRLDGVEEEGGRFLPPPPPKKDDNETNMLLHTSHPCKRALHRAVGSFAHT